MRVKEKKKSQVDDAARKFDGDLKSCMNCRFFTGNDSRCINSKCCKEEETIVKPIVKEKSECSIEVNVAKLKSNRIKDKFYKEECKGCPYANETGTCFHICFKNILARK